MGGHGSGRWYRYGSKKDTVEGQHFIDVRWLARKGMLTPGHYGNLQWSRNGRPMGNIGIVSRDDRVVLHYRIRQGGGDWQDVTEPVWLDWTTCHYGGRRPWFLCPHCRRRVAVLYGAGLYFLCRRCYNLAYESQQEDLAGRLRNRAQKIRQRLWGSGSLAEPFPDKPKWMHWRTYERLAQEMLAVEEASYRALLATIRRREAKATVLIAKLGKW